MKPLVSIIIPTYNRGHLIGETLDSVVAQTYTNWECIIVDDGSTDNTDEVVGEYQEKDNRFKYYHRPNDYAKGANSCRHIGFLKSKGEFINWFDSDDIMLPEHIKLKVEKIQQKEYDFVVCEITRWYQDSSEKSKIKIKNNYEINPIVGQFIGALTMSTPGPLWRKSFLDSNKIYYKPNHKDVNDTVLNDWTFSLDALFISKKFTFIKQELILYRFHSDSIYTERLKLKPEKFLDEYLIRKKYYVKSTQIVGNVDLIEEFYAKRILKIIRVLIVNNYASYNLIVDLLKNKYVSIFKKVKLLFYYTLAVTTGKGIDRLKYN